MNPALEAVVEVSPAASSAQNLRLDYHVLHRCVIPDGTEWSGTELNRITPNRMKSNRTKRIGGPVINASSISGEP